MRTAPIVTAALLLSSSCFQDELVAWRKAACGNGLLESPEECDGSDLGGATCESLGYAGGTLACSPDCTLDTSRCIPRPGSEICDNQIDDDSDGLTDCDDPDCIDPTFCGLGVCGNGLLESPEECDGSDLGGATCVSLGYTGGTLACSPDCTLDTSRCIPRPGSEICDNQIDDDSDGLTDCSDPDCLQIPGACPICGNGIAESAEECDGTDLAGQTCESLGFQGGRLTCNPDCTLNASGCQ